ncbi:MAG: hypothetical protein ACM3VT_00750 [Solirubrobacterales bacterium]
MTDEVVAELRLGRDGRAGEWRYYLPTDSRATEGFSDPVSIILRLIRSHAPEDSEGHTKGDSGGEVVWGNRNAVVDAFTQLWPDVLQHIAGLGHDTVHLVYFSAPATEGELCSLWPYMPFGIKDKKHFFVSEVFRDSHTPCPSGWLCVEYAYEDFKRMTGPEGFGFPYGTTIMGLSVKRADSDEFLKMDPLDKDVLERALGRKDLRCWWFCDTDFEGMTIWHKDVSGCDLLEQLRPIVQEK